ncbi:MAG: nucleotidyl transferase AbiEii/AbiGii toxin family protein [Clostridia bacterium]|nr:nucleotidyl transferase AbiEii/AbiGii toxin family protein [Clostridia bacterium]
MVDLNAMIEFEIQNGYGDANAQAKVCQDLILKAISNSSISRNVTIKGGVVMRSKSKNTRRATQDMDIDFIRYSLADESIDMFISYLNCIDGLSLLRVGEIEELKQQDYHGKRVYIELIDDFGNTLVSKLDFGVHNRLDIEQEEYCFDIAWDEEGASLLINSNEQMFAEKLRSLLRFGAVSTRYKDIFDLYFLLSRIDSQKLQVCLESYIFSDSKMREKNNRDIVRRLEITFKNKSYMNRLRTTDKKWLDEDIEEILMGITKFIEAMG